MSSIRCCTTHPVTHDAGRPLPLDALETLLGRAAGLDLRLLVMLEGDPSPHEVRPVQLPALLAAACDRAPDAAWVVRRPGCAGVRNVIVLTAGGERLASVSAARAPMAPEPLAWRALTLLPPVAFAPWCAGSTPSDHGRTAPPTGSDPVTSPL